MALVTLTDKSGKFTVMIAFILSFSGAIGLGGAGFLKGEGSYMPVYVAVCIITVISLLLILQVGRLMKREQEASSTGLR